MIMMWGKMKVKSETRMSMFVGVGWGTRRVIELPHERSQRGAGCIYRKR